MVQEDINFPGEAKCTRTHQNFHESFLKISQEHIQFSRRKQFHKNRSNFLGDTFENFVRTHKIFQEKEIP